MAKQYYSVLTDYGTQVIAGAIASKQPLQITQMAVGDGEGRTPTPDSRKTGLVREVHRANISAISVDPRNDKQIIFELTIPENVGGFWIREMGIFDNQNRLVAYANCPDSFKPELTSGSGKVQVVRMILLVSSSDAITLKVDDSVIFVTRGQLTPKAITATTKNAVDETGHSHEIDKASTSQAGIVELDSSINSKAENKAATPKAVKTAYDKAKAADDNANTRVSKSGGEMTGGLKLKANYGASEKKWDYSGFYAGSATLNNEALPYFQIHIGSYGGNTARYAKSLGFNSTDYKAYVMNWNSEGEYAGKKEILTELHRSDSVTSASSDTVATSKAVKTAYDKAVDGVNKANAAQTAANNAQTTANAAIPSSKKSDSVTSASSDTVATSKAVKTAYDKAVDGVNKANAAQTAANNAQTTANAAIPSSKKSDSVTSASRDTVATSKAVKSANDNANGRVSKSGDTMTGKLTVSEINLSDRKLQFGDDYIYKRNNGAPDAFVFFENTTPSDGSKGNALLSFRSASALHYGGGGYVDQYNSKAPFFVEEDNSDVKDFYLPFVKGRVRQRGQYGAAFSFGYATRQSNQGSSDGFGRGIVHLIEDTGNINLWQFEHNGDFISFGDVIASGVSLKSLNTFVNGLGYVRCIGEPHNIQLFWSNRGLEAKVDNTYLGVLSFYHRFVGMVAYFAGKVPDGWLKANGAAVSRKVYADLFSRIGTTYGAGDGRSTFNLPDLRGEFIRGLDDMRGVDNGRALGSWQGDELRAHNHFIRLNGVGAGRVGPNEGGLHSGSGKPYQTEMNGGVETRPRNVALLACIKY